MPSSTLKSTRMSLAVLASTLLVIGSLASPVSAAGDSGGGSGDGGGSGGGSGGGDGGGGSDSDTTLRTCPKGQVWISTRKRCVRQQSGILPDEDLTNYAYALAKAERYQETLDILDTLRNPDTPKALNYRGYATRKLGRVDEGITYYLKSVAMAPDYAHVREYLGEAYVIKGRIDLAREQLELIQKLCGNTSCEEYEDLHEAIEAAM